jgi:endoglucanase
MTPLAGVPFPYEAGSMPTFPNELVGTWIESAFLNYQNDGTVAKVQSLLDIAVDFAATRQVPLFCGEFGVFIPNSDNNDRVYWYEEVRRYLEQNGIGWTIWDYHGGFGLFEADGNDLFEHDLNVPLLEALGFTVPPQSDYVKEPDTTGIIIYTDYTGERIQNYGSGSQLINFYSTDLPNNDSYCLKWSEANQYQAIGFDFTPDKDLSYLVDNDYALDLFIRGNTLGMRFDLRFIDTKTSDINDHPWRMVYTISEGETNWDHKWHHARIPLKDFAEQGSWDGSWFEPQGDFDWSDVDLFEIVAEHQDLGQATFWFDNIIITDVDTAQVNEDNPFEDVLGFDNLESSERKIKIFPNPVADLLNIEINDSKPFSYILYDMTGKVVISSKASQKVKQGVSDLENGLYFLKIVTQDNITFSDKIYKQ